jgi:nitrogen regulatory protein PII-like uncharacterized protein
MAKILWIEDEGKLRLGHMIYPLLIEGHLIDIAESAHEAISFLKRNSYDALIFDLIIPLSHINESEETMGERSYDTDEELIGFGLLKDIVYKKIKNIHYIDPSKIIIFSIVAEDYITKMKELGINEDFILRKRVMSPQQFKQYVDVIIKAATQ